jgi:carbon-monoxide dehydrogenase medium subunit
VKPPPFSYHRAGSGEHAVALLSALGPRARVLAGGQSLLPMLNLRLADPPHLVDIGRADDLRPLRRSEDTLVVGAATTQGEVEHSSLTAAVPLLAEAVGHVAHPPIRHRGTVVGSMAHASAVAELPCVALVLDARFTLLGADGVRTVAAQDFFLGPFHTAVGPGELVAEVALPVAEASTGQAWSEFSLRRGNFPVAGAGVSLTLDGDRVSAVAIGLCGVADRPVRATAAERLLLGEVPTGDLLAAAAAAAADGLERRPTADPAAHILPVPAAPVPGFDYRARVARSQVRRALTTALARAGGTR